MLFGKFVFTSSANSFIYIRHIVICYTGSQRYCAFYSSRNRITTYEPSRTHIDLTNSNKLKPIYNADTRDHNDRYIHYMIVELKDIIVDIKL